MVVVVSVLVFDRLDDVLNLHLAQHQRLVLQDRRVAQVRCNAPERAVRLRRDVITTV